MGKKIYVGNLPFSMDDAQLSEKFSNFGQVDSAKIIMDRDTNRSKGFGFVEMADDSAAETAISQLNGTELGGRKLNVSEAKPQQPRQGGGGGRRFGGSDRGPRRNFNRE